MIKNKSTAEILKYFVSIQSDTNTKMEIDVESAICSYISELPYFSRNNDYYGIEKLSSDSIGRGIVWALIKGSGNKTVILLNHHDTVDVNDYKNLKDIAHDTDKIINALKTLNLSQEITQDIVSKDWIFGRGTADMKGGLSIQLKVIEDLSNSQFEKCNILFLSVPDEETLSTGMRDSGILMKQLQQKYDLEYSLIINSEPHTRNNDNIPVIYEGSVGKTMVTVYIKGIKSHIGEIFAGFNPMLVLSKIICNTEINSELCDNEMGEISVPPSWSFARDFKECYDASIPESAGGYINFLTLSKTPKRILYIMKEICKKSMEEAIEHYNKNSSIYHQNNNPFPYPANVMLYDEFLSYARTNNKEEVDRNLENAYVKVAEKIKNGLISIPESNFEIIKSIIDCIEYNGPMIIIAISPPYYPHISNHKFDNLNSKLKKLSDTVSEINKSLNGFGAEKQQYFMGISDLSYAAIQNYEDTAPYIKNNMPLWKDDFYSIQFESIKAFSTPVINIGPWGKDIHKYTERVYLPDIEINTPFLIKELISHMFS